MSLGPFTGPPPQPRVLAVTVLSSAGGPALEVRPSRLANTRTERGSRVVIQRLATADADRLLDFYHSLSDEVQWFYRPFGDVEEASIREHLDGAEAGRHIALAIVREDGVVLGHAFIAEVRGVEPVLGIGLHQSIHGMGWGRRLMEAVLAEADCMSVPFVTLTVLKSNHRAKTLYDSLGFVVEGESTFRSENDSYYMVRRCLQAARPA